LVRLAGKNTDTSLIDANLTGNSKFHDSFLAEGKTLDIGSPLNI
jgi:hypothetical protein